MEHLNDWSNISYTILGSKELYDQLLADIYELTDKALSEKLCPMYLEVGNLFIDVGICTALKESTGEPWVECVQEDRENLSNIFASMKRDILDSIDANSSENSSCKLSSPSELGVSVVYNPDEPYISLTACHSFEKAKENQPATGDGHLIVTLRLSESEILTDYFNIINNT